METPPNFIWFILKTNLSMKKTCLFDVCCHIGLHFWAKNINMTYNLDQYDVIRQKDVFSECPNSFL